MKVGVSAAVCYSLSPHSSSTLLFRLRFLLVFNVYWSVFLSFSCFLSSSPLPGSFIRLYILSYLHPPSSLPRLCQECLPTPPWPSLAPSHAPPFTGSTRLLAPTVPRASLIVTLWCLSWLHKNMASTQLVPAERGGETPALLTTKHVVFAGTDLIQGLKLFPPVCFCLWLKTNILLSQAADFIQVIQLFI